MLTVIILSHNEADNIKSCLDSVQFADEVLVVDDNSTDDTVKIARKSNARVVTHPLDNDFANQRNWAMSQSQYDWILFVDPDEVVDPNLSTEILKALPSTSYSAFSIPRKDYFFGQELKFGDTGNQRIIRLVRKNTGSWTGKVHEVWSTTSRIGQLKHPLHHYPHPTIVSFLRSINFYSSIRAQELKSQMIKSNTLSFTLLPLLKFLYLWIFRLGFLDGTRGIIHALMMSFYTFLVRAKLYLLWKNIKGQVPAP